MKRLTLCAVIVSGCAGSETGNGFNEYGVDLTMVAFNDLPVLAALDEDGVVFTIAEARASVTRIELVLPHGTPCTEPPSQPGTVAPYSVVCQGHDRLIVNGPWVADLVTGMLTPSLTTLVVPGGEYARVEVGMAPSAALGNATFVVAGTFVLDGETRHYDLTLAFDEKARFEPDGAWSLHDDQSLDLLVDVRGWFDELPVSACVAEGEVPSDGGVYHLDATTPSCANVRAAVQKAIKEAGKAKPAKKPHGPG